MSYEHVCETNSQRKPPFMFSLAGCRAGDQRVLRAGGPREIRAEAHALGEYTQPSLVFCAFAVSFTPVTSTELMMQKIYFICSSKTHWLCRKHEILCLFVWEKWTVSLATAFPHCCAKSKLWTVSASFLKKNNSPYTGVKLWHFYEFSCKHTHTIWLYSAFSSTGIDFLIAEIMHLLYFSHVNLKIAQY